ncbi:alpha/beta hydrolase, partial [Pauljensenia sp. 20925_1_27]
MKMHVYESGGEDSPAVLIIHPMLSSASSMRAALCDHMGPGLRFLVPDLSAHGDEASAPYVSAAAEAASIHEWLTSHEVRRLSLGFGASLGGVILFELLRFSDLAFDRLFIEGVSFYSGGPVARVGGAVLSRVMVAKHRKAVRAPDAGARKLAHLYGEQRARAMASSFAAMSEDSIRAI